MIMRKLRMNLTFSVSVYTVVCGKNTSLIYREYIYQKHKYIYFSRV